MVFFDLLILGSYFYYSEHSVIIHGIRFGLLDDTDPTTTEIGCQSSSKSGPTSDSGWALASSTNPIHRMAIVGEISRWNSLLHVF